MKFSIITMSHERLQWVQDGIALYETRLRKFAAMEHIVIKPNKAHKNLPLAERMKKDVEIFLHHVPKQSTVIVCDERSEQHTSKAFSQLLEKNFTHTPQVCFIIGPAYGLSPILRDQFATISLSKMTLQHEMVHLLLTEQLYRAMTILSNHPYHL